VLRDPSGYRTDKQGEKMAGIAVQDKTNSDTAAKWRGERRRDESGRQKATLRASVGSRLATSAGNSFPEKSGIQGCFVLGCVAQKSGGVEFSEGIISADVK
jgi:hypothetical protein